MSDAPVAKVISDKVPYGWPESRDIPGYVLDNGLVLLEKERDENGRYKAGAGMDGMYLQTGRVFEAVTDDGGAIIGFSECLPGHQISKEAITMDNEDKKIRFIDSNYKTLFYIPDGANIVLTVSDGEQATRACKYLDEMHVQIGKEVGRGEVLHICQFAEIMERNGTTYKPEKSPELPDKCFSNLPSTGELILIEKGKKGYTPCPWYTGAERNRQEADRGNSQLGVTRQQEAAMLGGATRGWASPAAETFCYDFKGEPVTQAKSKKPKNREPER